MIELKDLLPAEDLATLYADLAFGRGKGFHLSPLYSPTAGLLVVAVAVGNSASWFAAPADSANAARAALAVIESGLRAVMGVGAGAAQLMESVSAAAAEATIKRAMQ